MNKRLLLLVGILTMGLPAVQAAGGFDDAHKFLYYAILEGCYEDGLSNSDIDQILLRTEEQGPYVHFIYSCPLCMPAIHAFEAYRSRPNRFFGYKGDASTFGDGIDAALSVKLHAPKSAERLDAINALIQRWVQRRMAQLRLTEPERTHLQQELEARRKKGMEALLEFKRRSQTRQFAPAFAELEECAVCNGAVGKSYLPVRK